LVEALRSGELGARVEDAPIAALERTPIPAAAADFEKTPLPQPAEEFAAPTAAPAAAPEAAPAGDASLQAAQALTSFLGFGTWSGWLAEAQRGRAPDAEALRQFAQETLEICGLVQAVGLLKAHDEEGYKVSQLLSLCVFASRLFYAGVYDRWRFVRRDQRFAFSEITEAATELKKRLETLLGLSDRLVAVSVLAFDSARYELDRMLPSPPERILPCTFEVRRGPPDNQLRRATVRPFDERCVTTEGLQ
jgi:hypothetical protein